MGILMTETMPLEQAIALAQSPPVGGLLAATPGRLTVAPGQPIASSWGNTTYDQTCQCYANAADRDNQWPAPNDGATCFLADSKTVWRRVAGAWGPVGMGLMARAIGPASQVDITSIFVVASIAANLIGGRRYRVTGHSASTIITATAVACYFQIADTAGLSGAYRIAQGANLAVNAQMHGMGAPIYEPSVSGPTTFQLGGLCSSGALRTAANACHLWLEDIS